MTEPSDRDDPEVFDAEIVPVAPVTPSIVAPTADYDEHGVPSFDYVRDKIEGRAATAAGYTELTSEADRDRALDEQIAARDDAGRKRLEEIRRSLGL